MPNTKDLLLEGADVSDYQHPNLVDWTLLQFGIVKASDGMRTSKRLKEHALKIRAADAFLGLYHFVRLSDSHPIEQCLTFVEASKTVDYGPGVPKSIVPAIDLEDYPGFQLENAPEAYSNTARLVAEYFATHFGNCLVYLSAYNWKRLGSPAWVTKYPLWVPHYPSEGARAWLMSYSSPGGIDAAIYQGRVGPQNSTIQNSRNPKAIDNNLAIKDLPLIPSSHFNLNDKTQIPWCFLSDNDHAEMTAARDRILGRLETP